MKPINVERKKTKLMFTEITWAMYLRVTAAILFIYYTLLLLKFYFPQIRATLSNGQSAFDNPQSVSGAEMRSGPASGAEKSKLTPTGEFNEPGSNDYEIIEEMVERVKGALKEASDAALQDDAVKIRLKEIVRDYPLFSKSTFRPSINEFIATESQQHGFTSINEDSVEEFWQA